MQSQGNQSQPALWIERSTISEFRTRSCTANSILKTFVRSGYKVPSFLYKKKVLKMSLLVILVAVLCLSGVCEAQFNLWTKDVTKCGEEASTNLVHHNPWLVYLEYWRNDLTEIRCAATLIDSRHLITAAHCIMKPRFNSIIARFGEYDLYSKKDCVNGVCADPVVRIKVEDVYVHPEYDGKEHDIAILRLAEDAPYTDFIRPICLPSRELKTDTTLFAAGWGEIPMKGVYAHVKKIIPLPLWDRANCQKSYKHNILPQSIICAGGEEGIDTCRGDSGGPLTRVQEKVELLGVTSGGNPRCGTKNSPGIYTKVVDYLEWIQAVLKS